MKAVAAVLLTVSFNAHAVCNADAARLIKAYPDYLVACEDNYLIWRDGEKQLFDDGKEKTAEQLLNAADVEDMFAYAYPVGASAYTPPALNVNPGRVRNEAFFKKMYGATREAVESQLVTIPWLPQSGHKTVRVTRVNGVDKKLAQISAELDQLPAALKKYVLNTAGTFNWRTISGTERLSGHSFAIAIDIDTKFSNYWRWAGKKYQYKNQIPPQIVELFEKHGFIWGGKWYHYDTMHFEYRPELFLQP